MAISSIEPSSVRILRGALISIGVLLLTWLHHDLGSSQLSVVIGLLMQVSWGSVSWLVRRYEARHHLVGFLRPTAAFILELLIDAITVAMFAYAVLRQWWQAGHAL